MDSPQKKRVQISIRDFAVPTPRTGSIEANNGYGAQLEGIEIHQEVQSRRESSDSTYQPEVKIDCEFEREGYVLEVEGRMDGIFDGKIPKIEEIKSSFSVYELKAKLEGNPKHPYCLQLLTYGYFYFKKHGVIPNLNLHLVSSRNRSESLDLEIKLDIEDYEQWLEARLQEIEKEVARIEKRTARREKMARDFEFPFEKVRPGQRELIETIDEGMKEQRPLWIQAPTGLGKTAGVLYPTLKEAMTRGQRVVYVTPKNSQHSVAEDAVERFQEKGTPVKSLTITAKTKMCMKAEPLCNPTYCEYARDYYDKLSEHELVEVLAKKKKLSAKTFKDMGEKYEVCPFELQLDASKEAEVIICDYNYVFSTRSALSRVTELSVDQKGKPNLVVDEAHNLPSRAMGYYSPQLSCFTLERLKGELQDLPKRFAKSATEAVEQCIRIVKACKPAGAMRPAEVDPPVEEFLEQDQLLNGLLSQYLEADVEIQSQDPLLALCFYWGDFTDRLEQISHGDHDEFFTTFQPDQSGGTIKITCCDPSEMLEERYDQYEQVVGFSATLKPFDFYLRLSGLKDKNVKIAEFQSPFLRENRKVMIIPQVSTKMADRDRNYGKIAETISRMSALKAGNYVAFFPSFDFLEKVENLLKIPGGFQFRKQMKGMKNSEVEEILEELKSEATPTIFFAVQGGVFSEGVDYPGNMLIGAFVIGPPLPTFDLERELMRKYYEEHYQEGFDYAYAYPAMAKAVQAAGRVIRTENDKGVIVLMDRRFLDRSYTKSMPGDWFENGAQELVSQSILKDTQDFWDRS